METQSKSCFNCDHCYNDTICILLDDLIIGYCFMHKPKKEVVIE
jgi:hypothetical protein